MGFRIMSDLHLEFGEMCFNSLPTDNNDVLVLAGDIGVADMIGSFEDVAVWAQHFKHTILIAGNHEFYCGSLVRARDKIKQYFADVGVGSDKISVVENEIVRIDDVSYICATLWTDYDNNNPLSMLNASASMNDYDLIRTGTPAEPYKEKISPYVLYNEHMSSRKFIFRAIESEKAKQQKTVVVTHHAPSWQSIAPKFASSPANSSYASNLDNQIWLTQPDVWCHGHTHVSFDYHIGSTRIICNPRGYYPDWLNPNFNPTLRVDFSAQR
jgi:predicted phosphodiesterase